MAVIQRGLLTLQLIRERSRLGCGPAIRRRCTTPSNLRKKTVMASDKITTLDEATFDEEVGGAETAVLVDFWAEWCGPCKMIAPILDEIADENDGIKIAKLNVDDAPDIARRFDVMSIPTLIVFKDGEPAKRLVGAKGKAQLVSEIEEYLS